jgi:N-hydroxyarylamine O-acetyltransferase
MPFDLDAYVARIEYSGGFQPTTDTLRELHLAHATHIPFENIDVLLRRPIRLDLDSLTDKLVRRKRGGYCFEQNTLFAAVLESAGFRVRRLAARVRWGATGIRPRTHMLLQVEAGGGQWIADVGFGGDGLLLPIRFLPGEPAAQFAWQYRIMTEGETYILQSARPAGWLDLYVFTLEEQFPIDYELANHYTSTYPESRFVKVLTAQKPGPELRLSLLNRTLTQRRADGEKEILLADDEAIREALAELFGLQLPVGTRFPFEEAAAIRA